MRKKRAMTILGQGIALLLFIALCTFKLRSGYQQFYCAAYPLDYQEDVTAASKQYNIPPSLIYAVIRTESNFDSDATSSANAKGLMQLTENTFQWAVDRAGDTTPYSNTSLFDPSINIRYGTYYLTILGEQFEQTETILAAYNAGPGTVKQWLQDPRYSSDGKALHTIPYSETADYVIRVLEAQKQYQTLYSIQ